jgi:hypothetical protein
VDGLVKIPVGDQPIVQEDAQLQILGHTPMRIMKMLYFLADRHVFVKFVVGQVSTQLSAQRYVQRCVLKLPASFNHLITRHLIRSVCVRFVDGVAKTQVGDQHIVHEDVQLQILEHMLMRMKIHVHLLKSLFALFVLGQVILLSGVLMFAHVTVLQHLLFFGSLQMSMQTER